MSIWLEESVLCADCKGRYHIGENWDGTIKTCTCEGGRRDIGRDLLDHTEEDYDDLRTITLSAGGETVTLKEVVSIVTPDRGRHNLIVNGYYLGKQIAYEVHDRLNRIIQQREIAITLDGEPIRGKYYLREMCWTNPLKHSMNWKIDMIRVDYSDGESPPVHGPRIEVRFVEELTHPSEYPQRIKQVIIE